MWITLLKKTLYIPPVIDDGKWRRRVEVNGPEIEKDLYGLFNIGAVSINLAPIWWTMYESIEELNEKFWTHYKEKDAGDFNKAIKGAENRLKEYYESIGYKD